VHHDHVVVAEVLFAVPDLIVTGESLGRSYNLTRADDSFSVALHLPETVHSFRPRHHDGHWWSFLAPSTEGLPEYAKIVAVRMMLTFPERVQPEDVGPEPPLREALETVRDMSDTAAKVGAERLAAFLETVRVGRQFWLGLSLEPPRILDGPDLYDDFRGAHDRLPVGATIATVSHGHVEADRATPDLLDRAATAVVAGTVPLLEDRLLADARVIVRRGPTALLPQALVLAAISTEIRIKRTLEELASADQRDLIQILLNSPRDYSVAAQRLFDRPLKAISGHSLKDDDKELWKAAGALFVDRNAVAHKGAVHDVTRIREDVGSALRLKKYLANVATGGAATAELETRPDIGIGPPGPIEYRMEAEPST
jgi:hypothetical protein